MLDFYVAKNILCLSGAALVFNGANNRLFVLKQGVSTIAVTAVSAFVVMIYVAVMYISFFQSTRFMGHDIYLVYMFINNISHVLFTYLGLATAYVLCAKNARHTSGVDYCESLQVEM